MDARNPAARRELAQLGDLIGALRLPGGAMRAAAGTEAVMDLLVLRRREPGTDPDPATPGWDTVVDVDVPHETDDDSTNAVEMNRYFAEHPDRVLGVTVAGRGMYRDGELMVRGDIDTVGERVAAGLALVIDASPLRYMPPPPLLGGERTASSSRRRLGDVELAGERLVPLREDSFVVSRSGVIYRHSNGELIRAEVPKSARHEVRALVVLRDAALNLLHLEAHDFPDARIEVARVALREAYERYRHWWGPLNRVKWSGTGKIDPETGQEKRRRIPARLGGFRADPDWPTLSAIEVYDEGSVFGNAGAIDGVATDVYVWIARRFGAQVTTVEEAFARVDLRRTLDRLDLEQNPEDRAGLIDHAIELAEQHPALAEEAPAAGVPVPATASPPSARAADGQRRLDAVRPSESPGLGL
jgi:hypothetical protein